MPKYGRLIKDPRKVEYWPVLGEDRSHVLHFCIRDPSNNHVKKLNPKAFRRRMADYVMQGILTEQIEDPAKPTS